MMAVVSDSTPTRDERWSREQWTVDSDDDVAKLKEASKYERIQLNKNGRTSALASRRRNSPLSHRYTSPMILVDVW